MLLTLNMIAVDNQTKGAEVTVEGGRILNLAGGDIQVVEEGPTAGGGKGARSRRGGARPIVLIHCYGCSLHWWDRMAPILAKRHRVVRLDLLGFGGSEKPASGYEIEQQASLVASALTELRVQGAIVVGHSLGVSVATALAGRSSELVDRLVNIDQAPDESYADFPLIAQLGYVPVLGQLLNRITPDFAIEDGYETGFAPGYEIENGFEDPDQVVDDFHAMTYTSYEEVADAEEEYTDEVPLDTRLANAAVPLMVIFGAEDQLYEPASEALAAYEDVPGARLETVEGAGHSPNVEKPEETARLVLDFAER